MEIVQPYYYLKLNVSGCPRLIAVNGFEIERDLKGAGNFSEYPINQYLKNGENKLYLTMPNQSVIEKRFPNIQKCEIEIRVSGRVDGEEKDYLVSRTVYSPDYSDPPSSMFARGQKAGRYSLSGSLGEAVSDPGGDIEIGAMVLDKGPLMKSSETYSRTFSASVPFSKWAFFEADKLVEFPFDNVVYESLKDEFWPKVEEIRDLFEQKNIENILRQFELRSDEYDKAFYREKGETLSMLKQAIEAKFKADLPQDRLEKGKMKLYVNYNGNGFTFKNAASDSGTVIFYDKEWDGYNSFDVYWIKKDGKWIIAR